jgi:TRAP-type C4-dicarboxylate transport system permease small subunit
MQQARKKIEENTGGAVGAGVVLVLLPSLALILGLDQINKIPLAGLPLLAIFGIMILFGSLALTSTLFARLKLHNAKEALGLPSGSVRATIALSLIVLFAIIAIMLHQSVAEPFEIKGLSEAEKNAVVRDLAQRVIGVRPHLCPAAAATPAPTASAPATAASPAATPPATAASAAPCASTYDVLVLPPRGQEATDLAKQLLILIGTLMTSVTSYYFAARTSEGSAPPETPKEATTREATPPAPAAAAAAPPDAHEDHLDGCSVAIADATPDHELPSAQGGVA